MRFFSGLLLTMTLYRDDGCYCDDCPRSLVVVIVVIATRRAFPYDLPLFMTHRFLLGNLYVGMDETASVVVVTVGLLEAVFSFVVVNAVIVGIMFVLRRRFGSA